MDTSDLIQQANNLSLEQVFSTELENYLNILW